ncbi:hypothetical protein JAAARDRAFT_195904 [Jaapia argillacea MUCL 33604]|uniref:GIT Spa2 homology (SHD) domain-containing protein n=1 Tax=Jaapia argillacea MUCL 33604 TaxID=933084 RepID=A0A067PUS0_9AGAM|nr:hypothetical protein JAAARDRAFT_195904 [Jaapia argillacea MUCL 33604]
MKRSTTATSRSTSPTPTAFSGISNYRSESYRPGQNSGGPGNSKNAMSGVDPKTIAKAHFEELSRYLADYLAAEPANSRSSARQKLTRLTRQQFQELSTDVYDELMRRKNNSGQNEVPFLPVRDDFHPKRNQARQKLATLPTSRFQDLSSDVYFELSRRYPEFKEEATREYALPPHDVPPTPGSSYDDYPSPDFPTSPKSAPPPPNIPPPVGRSGRASEDRGMDSGYGGSASGRRPSMESYGHRRPSMDDFAPIPNPPNSGNGAPPARRSEDQFSGTGRPSEENSANNYSSNMGSSRRKPSQDVRSVRSEDRRRPSQDNSRRSEDREGGWSFGRRPSTSTTSDSTSTTNPQSAMATSGMIIPNKSTIAEEEIEVPFGREARDSGSTAIDDRDRERERSFGGDIERSRDVSRELEMDGSGEGDGMTDGDGEGERDLERESVGEYLGSPRSAAGLGLGLGGLSGLSGLSARLGTGGGDDEDDGGARGPRMSSGVRSGEDYFDRMSFGRASVASDRSFGGGAGGRTEEEAIRREYEFKIATMQTKISSLERDLEDEREKSREQGVEKVLQLEAELDSFRRRAEEQAAAMHALQKELDEVKEDRARDKELASRRVREDEEELQILRDRCERLETERASGGSGGADFEMVEQLRSDMEGLMIELTDLSRRNDELLNAKESDLTVIHDLDLQVKEYKRKYELAKTELRSVKATSQLFLPTPKSDDQLPTSSDGGVLDIHVTAFVTAIDTLLKEGRSNSPTRVLMPMKAVVNAVTAIVDDLRKFERRPAQERMEIDLEALRALRDRAEATLSNLVAVSKTHATSNGMSPVSLLDAAASHVSLTITDIGKTVCIRKATKVEQEQFSVPPSNFSGSGFSPIPRSVEEARLNNRSSNSRRDYSSPTASVRFVGVTTMSPTQMTPGTSSGEERRRPPSEPSSSNASSPPPIFDQPSAERGGMSDESAIADGPEDAWAELKPYLEAQTEAIVYAIQSVLSGVRSPTPSPTLNENLTQIITIVSSIVAVCKDNLPPTSAQQGNEILHELSDHANKLSEVQSLPEVTKESRQIMAKSSFAVANAMKGLMKLS